MTRLNLNEAQLITSAESMKKKFAALVWNTVESFKYQGVSPRSLITGVLYLTEGEDPLVGKPLLEKEKDRLAKAQNVDAIFDILRPHMTMKFWNSSLKQEDQRKINRHFRSTFMISNSFAGKVSLKYQRAYLATVLKKLSSSNIFT